MSKLREEKIPKCPDCKLYWFYVSEDEIEFRLSVFAPIEIKKCPFCEGINKYPITDQALDFQKVGRKEITLEAYHKKYGKCEEG